MSDDLMIILIGLIEITLFGVLAIHTLGDYALHNPFIHKHTRIPSFISPFSYLD